MTLERIDVFRFPVPFKVVFRHASASRSEAANIIVAARGKDGVTGYGEGCPREYVTGESVPSAAAFVRKHRASIVGNVRDVRGLLAWAAAHRREIDANPAAFCAIEIAVLDLLGRLAGQPIEDLLGVSRLAGAFRYSAVLGDSSMKSYEAQVDRYRKMGFRDFKLKVSGNAARDRQRLMVLARAFSPPPRIRLDANNLWQRSADAVAYMRRLDCRAFALEEPLGRGDIEGCRRIAGACGVRIILDESIVRAEQLKALHDPETWIVNLRVSKMGGISRSLAVAAEAADRGIGLVAGAQVGETSLLTRAALTAMNERRQEIIAAEGAFGTLLLRRDLTDPCLMFGHRGELTAGRVLNPANPGLGLNVRDELLKSI